MGIDANSVQVVINVTDANSAAAVAGVTGNLDKLGAAGAGAGVKMKTGMDGAGAAALSSRDKVRLLSEEFGVRIPRAMQSVISKCPAVMTAINGIGTAMIGLGMIQIGSMVFGALISGAEKLWHNVLDVNAAMKDYNVEMAKSRMEDFGNAKSIETVRLRLEQATDEAKQYHEIAARIKAEADSPLHALDPAAPYMYYQAHLAENQAMDAQRQADKLRKESELEQHHDQQRDQIELEHAYDWRLSKEQQITAEREKQHELNAEDARYTRQSEGYLGNPVASGWQQSSFWTTGKLTPEQSKDLLANAKAEKELADLKGKRSGGGNAKSQAEEIAHIHEQAIESEMRGEALYHQQEAAAIEDLKRRGISSAQAVEDVHTKFHNEEMRRLQEETRQTEEIEQRSKLAGLTGTARITQEGANQISDINSNPNLDDENKARRRAAIQHEIDVELAAERKSEVQKQQEDADRVAEHQRHAADETAQIEGQARVRSLSAEKQKTASIQAELEERLQKYQEELDQQQISQDDYNRRAIAAEQEADAQKIEAATEARKKMGGEFESFFKGMSDPQRYFKDLGDKMAGQAAAALWQGLQTHLGHSQGGDSTATPGGFFGGLATQFGFGKKKDVNTSAGTHDTHSTAQGSFSVAQAVIHVGSASIVGGAGAGTSAGSTWSGGGSTIGGGGLGGGDFGGSVGGGAPFEMGAGGSGGGGNNISGAIGAGNSTLSDDGQIGTFGTGGSGGGISSIPGSSGSASTAGGMSMAGAMGTAQGVLGVYSASRGTGGMGGAMQGAMSGAEALSIFGPAGQLLGGIVGGALGFLGSKESAHVYDIKTVKPRIGNDQKGYEDGSMDYLSAYSDLESLRSEAFAATSKMGPSGRAYRNEHITPEIEQAIARLSSMEKAGRSQYTASQAQYAQGTDYVPGTGMALVHQGERIFSGVDNSTIVKAITEGNRGTMPAQGASSGDVHLHVHAIDAKGVAGFLDQYKHNLRAAINDSYIENSGGGMN